MKLVQKTNMTYTLALLTGYKTYRSAYSRGYVSRKINIMNQPVYTSGTGEFFIETPCWVSSRYLVRKYIKKI